MSKIDDIVAALRQSHDHLQQAITHVREAHARAEECRDLSEATGIRSLIERFNLVIDAIDDVEAVLLAGADRGQQLIGQVAAIGGGPVSAATAPAAPDRSPLPAPAQGSSERPSITRPTGPPGGKPDGRRTRIRPQEDDNVRRSLQRENDTADILADQGYRVRQNPTAPQVAAARTATGDTGRPTSEPDYLVEGHVFDCYAPAAGKNVRGVWTEAKAKVDDEQTQRVVINLQDWGGDVGALRTQFATWPINGLKEVKVVHPDGTIEQIRDTGGAV